MEFAKVFLFFMICNLNTEALPLLEVNSEKTMDVVENYGCFGSGRGQGCKLKTKAKTQTFRNGLTFSVGKINGWIRNAGYTNSDEAAAYIAAVLEYMVSDLCAKVGSKQINSQNLDAVMEADAELKSLLSGQQQEVVPAGKKRKQRWKVYIYNTVIKKVNRRAKFEDSGMKLLNQYTEYLLKEISLKASQLANQKEIGPDEIEQAVNTLFG